MSCFLASSRSICFQDTSLDFLQQLGFHLMTVALASFLDGLKLPLCYQPKRHAEVPYLYQLILLTARCLGHSDGLSKWLDPQYHCFCLFLFALLQVS